MQLTIQLVILLLLMIVFLQDMMYRAVTWYVFPLLITGLIALQVVSGRALSEVWPSIFINCCIIMLCLLGVTLFILLKYKRLVNITNDYLGVGDILFFSVFACYLSVLNFVFFYIVSLILTAGIWLPLQRQVKNKHIPLAGIQSLLLIFFLAGGWWCHLYLSDDELLQLISCS